MCGPTIVPSFDFSSINTHFLLTHCDDLCEKDPINAANNLLSYIAWSNCPGFDHVTCYNEMYNRTDPNDTTHYNYYNWETFSFKRRFKLLNSNNKAWELAVKLNPTIQDIEIFSALDPCFANLFPVKCYLSDHIDLLRDYKGMLPFGREVIKYYNSIVSSGMTVKGSPTFKDHVNLRELSYRKAILMGVPTITINNLMYHFGRTMNPSDIQDEN
jgi:hypothetical protein